MAHEQGNKPTDDPNKYGLKFDSGKPRWELLPVEQLMEIIRVFNILIPLNGMVKNNIKFDLTKFDREDLINNILQEILMYKVGATFNGSGQRYLAIIAFKMFFLLRAKPYTKEELTKSTSNSRWDLLDMKDVEGVVDVFTKGAAKYADNNWQKVSAKRYYDALIRHFNTVRTPERYDSELGCLHMHQAIWNVIALMWIESQIPESIMKASKKLRGVSLAVKPPRQKAAKKKVAKKKAAKKKKRTSSQ